MTKMVSKWYRWRDRPRVGPQPWVYVEEHVVKNDDYWKRPAGEILKDLSHTIMDNWTTADAIEVQLIKPSKVPLEVLDRQAKILRDRIETDVAQYNRLKKASEKYPSRSGVAIVNGVDCKKRMTVKVDWEPDDT